MTAEAPRSASYNPTGSRCGAKLKTRPGELCPNPPLTGAVRCRMHGSATKAARAAGQRTAARAALERAAVTYGLPEEIDPVDAMLGELARTHGVVRWLEAQVRGLEAGDVAWSQLEETEDEIGAGEFTGTNRGRKHGAAVHTLVQLYGQERDRLVRVAAECRKAGIEQAVQDRTRALADDFLAKLEQIVRALGHDPADPAVLRTIAAALRGPAGILEGQIA